MAALAIAQDDGALILGQGLATVAHRGQGLEGP